MRCPPSTIPTLWTLFESGSLDELQARVSQIWLTGDGTDWDEEDIQFVCYLLFSLRKKYAERSASLYADFAQRIKAAAPERSWLQSLAIRAQVVEAYEGQDRTIEWLRDLGLRIPPPDDGVVSLELARFLTAQDRLIEARDALRHAVQQSLTGIVWYVTEALNAMGLCQLRMRNYQLAFEYAKAHAIESYQLGQLRADDLYKACLGNAYGFGNLAYAVDLAGNVAEQSRRERRFSHAAEHESVAGLRLAWLGVVAGAERLRMAAADARQGSLPGDPHFAFICELLARYVEPAPLLPGELAQALQTFRQRWSAAKRYAWIVEVRKSIKKEILPDASQWERWLSKFLGGHPEEDSSNDPRVFLILAHLVALLARFYHEARAGELAILLDQALMAADRGRDAVYVFAREHLAELLLAGGRPEEVQPVCEPILAREALIPSERFVFRQLLARSKLALGQAPDAYTHALAALADWRLVLEGLYAEEHKVAWLRRGEAGLACAIHAIRSPGPWIDEAKRRRELFRLMELGKARIVADMVNRRACLAGSYFLSDFRSDRGSLLQALRETVPEPEDWYVALVPQMASYADGLINVVHDDGGRIQHQSFLEVAPLRCAVQLPRTAEQRLLSTAASLAFAEVDIPPGPDLYQQFRETAG
jgi:hypothetical protein